MPAGDVRVVHDDVTVATASERRAARTDHQAAPAVDQQRALLARGGGFLKRLGQALGGAEHHRAPDRRAGLRLGCTGGHRLLIGLDNGRFDPELAKTETLVSLKLDHGPGEQRETLAPGVLEQVAGKLVGEGVLIAREAIAVAR